MSEKIDQTDAKAYVGIEAKSRLEDITALQAVATESAGYGLITDRDRLESLGVEVGPDGLVDADSALDRLYEMPLAVEAMTTFEIVLGVGGPDSRILVECDVTPPQSRPDADDGVYIRATAYEIRRVLFRYSWEGTGTVQLTGDDKETAEAFARRVVPELSE